jgi:hypothetical protein
MSFKSISIALAATAVFCTFGASPAYAGTPHCGVFTEDSGSVTIVSENAQYSNSQLYNDGRFSAVGPQFGCWIEIGTSPDIRDKMMFYYRVTDPKGQSNEFGPYGIQIGGFGSTSVPTYQTAGTWRMEFFLVSRENGGKSSIGAINFTMLP